MKTFSGCHQTEGPLPFVPMLVSRTERRFLAVLLAGVLLLCQTLAFANACPPITDKSGAAPCHDAGDPARAPSQDNCQHASPTSAFNVDLLAGFYWKQESCETLADRHGRSVNAIRLMLSRLRDKLRTCLSKRLEAQGIRP